MSMCTRWSGSSGPSLWRQRSKIRAPQPFSFTYARSFRHSCSNSWESDCQTFQVEPDRYLGFATYGKANGRPLIYFHGTPGSRLDVANWDNFATRHNIRLISIDRPGMGLSTFQPKRKFLDWPVDVVKLARHLGIGKEFTVIGVSGGGPYALACAYAIPERLKGVGVVAGMGPWQGFKTTEGMPWPRRINWLFGKYGGEAAVKVTFRETIEAIQVALDGNLTSTGNVRDLSIAHSQIRSFVEESKKRINNDEHPSIKSLSASRMTAFVQGAAGVAHENKLHTRPWDFDVKDIKFQGVTFFHGDQDNNCPLWHAKYLAERLPGCRLQVYKGEDHYAVTKGWVRLQTILRDVMDPNVLRLVKEFPKLRVMEKVTKSKR